MFHFCRVVCRQVRPPQVCPTPGPSLSVHEVLRGSLGRGDTVSPASVNNIIISEDRNSHTDFTIQNLFESVVGSCLK